LRCATDCTAAARSVGRWIRAEPSARRKRSQAPNPQIAQLQTPVTPNVANESSSKYGGSMSAGAAIQEATRAAAARRGGGQQGAGGDLWIRNRAHGRQLGNLEVLSDTMGVDFGPYLQRVLHDVRQNWYNAIPESAQDGRRASLTSNSRSPKMEKSRA
jgi:hypothetical protein